MTNEVNTHKAHDVTHLPDDVEAVVNQAHQRGKKVVLVTGVFDILHAEHQTFLRKAKAVGDVLVVGVESDARVKVMKGEARPINPEETRRQQVAESGSPDAVFILPEAFSSLEHYQGLVHHLKPAILAVSSHTAFLDRKQALMAEVGGEVKVVHDHNPAISTTILLQQQTTSERPL
jgi:rfaE bifunctional protein nucleotidyltransferase chain/domain